MWTLFRRTPGRSAASGLALAAAALLAGCNYGFQGGGGFPAEIRTIYIEPFENETPQFELQQQLFNEMLARLPRALGVRPAGRSNADAIVTGRIVRYDDAALNYRPGAAGGGAEVLEQQVQIGLSVQIVDVGRNLVLWDQSSLVGRGTYQEDVNQGREEAIRNLIQQIIDGAQNQW